MMQEGNERQERQAQEQAARAEEATQQAQQHANEKRTKQTRKAAAEEAARSKRSESERREQEAHKRAEEQLQAEQFAAKQRYRQRKEQAEIREKEVAARAQAAQRRIAQERLQQEREKEDEAKREREAILRNAQEEYLAHHRIEQEDYNDRWHSIVLARAKHEARLRQEALERSKIKRKAAEEQRRLAKEWEEARFRRHHQDDVDVKPALERLQCDDSSSSKTSTLQQREAEAAEKFIQEVMMIRGESRDDVLKDVALITIEAIDSHIQAQKARESSQKRTRIQDDRARLPTLVTELFTKLESCGESQDRFRFGKKRKLG
jgi:hypothetical protein